MGSELRGELRLLLEELGRVSPVITTIAKGNPNRIVAVDGQGVWISTEASDTKGSGPQLVPAWMLRIAWEHLRATGGVKGSSRGTAKISPKPAVGLCRGPMQNRVRVGNSDRHRGAELCPPAARWLRAAWMYAVGHGIMDVAIGAEGVQLVVRLTAPPPHPRTLPIRPGRPSRVARRARATRQADASRPLRGSGSPRAGVRVRAISRSDHAPGSHREPAAGFGLILALPLRGRLSSGEDVPIVFEDRRRPVVARPRISPPQ